MRFSCCNGLCEALSPLVLSWCFHCVPMVFPCFVPFGVIVVSLVLFCCCFVVPMLFPSLSLVAPLVLYCFPLLLPWSSIVFPCCSLVFPMLLPCFPMLLPCFPMLLPCCSLVGAWCRHCVKGKGINVQHRKKTKGGDNGVPWKVEKFRGY